MWADNETSRDLLGFSVHADLIEGVVTNPSLLPTVMGLFGDWGSGKSSIMRMLESRLASDEYPDVACLYFNGWVFEGYQDAKTALLSSILLQLLEHQRFGAKLKSKALALLRRVKWMEVAKLGVKHVGVPLAAGVLSGGPAGAMVALAASLGFSNDAKATEIHWGDLLGTDPEKPDALGIRKFRDDFAAMLSDCKIDSLVILIDDLDRCVPERIIDTLEAIKLFVAVPNTAFVIGADPRIVRHAIATRYVDAQLRNSNDSSQERYDLVQDYLEKLIQIPYHLPRLSPAEIETYVNLLSCEQCLTEEEFDTVHTDWSGRRTKNFYAPYTQDNIRSLTGVRVPEILERHLAWIQVIAPVITEGLKGNPRQIKRMLNAMMLRQRLAIVAGITIRDEVLAKLMVLEYTHFDRFRELNDWQSSCAGFPAELRDLEESFETTGDRPSDELPQEWQKSFVRKWLQMKPQLRDVDLRDYFWLARDRTSSTLAGVTMVAPAIRRLFDQLVGDNAGAQNIAARQVKLLGESEQEQVLELLRERVLRQPEEETTLKAFMRLHDNEVPTALVCLAAALRRAEASRLPPGLAFDLQGAAKAKPGARDVVRDMLEYLSQTGNTKIARAAGRAMDPVK